MDAKEIVHFALQVEKSSADRSYGTVSTVLADLDKMLITAEQLETTDIVKVLYRLLKSCPDGDIKKTVRGLLAKWKRQYGRGVKCTDEWKASARDSSADKIVDREVSEQGERSEEGRDGGLCVASECTSASPSISSLRSKCVQLLLDALSKELPNQEKAAMAENIERQIHELHKSAEVKYKACVRSKVANLRNPKNVHLQQELSSGALSPEAFARMSAEEMASPELRQLRRAYSSRGVSERQLPRGVEGTKTQKVRCRKCGGAECTVTQVSRGALFLPAWVRRGGPDDDAMTFVTCGDCGQQWYHSGWVCL
ncbi:transcription elongation factor A N-terminal and central domain-containing protein [Labrus mixtus]|uniref:transcription elongation factor A N-terminal and central domain-containing protein n=1 Tax=Labrus mixtus TaxID=508554 RepID=UPI0029BFE2C1|nr:transcription elongation factor A N-terminal and central domain-containing protein [Labrus mixtus]XP_060889021.1 transcription elongation factor A N-terminal and central domain-containing protein [Labrus mixtus]